VYKPVKAFLNKRSDKIDEKLKNAQDNLMFANDMKERYEKKLVEVEQEKEDILDNAKKNGLERREEIITLAKRESEQMKSRANLEIEREKDKVKDEVKAQIIDISSELARRIIRENINNDSSVKLIDEVIDELEDTSWLV